MNLHAEIREIVAKRLTVEEETVVPDAHLQADLGADSIEFLDLAEAIATQYGIDIQDDDLLEIGSVDDLAKFVQARIESKPQIR